MFVLGQLSAAVAAVPSDGISPGIVPTSSASVLAPPGSQVKEPSSSDDAGLDVPLQSLVAGPSGLLFADAAVNITSVGGVVASSRTAVVTFAEEVTVEASSSHAGETAPPPQEENPMTALTAAGDGNASEAGFLVEGCVQASASTWLPDISSIFDVANRKSSQKRGLAFCNCSFS